MTSSPDTQATDGVPTYVRRGDPAGRLADYHPAWMDKLASDVTREGSLLDSAVQGVDAVRAVVGVARELYDRQDFNFAGAWGDNRLMVFSRLLRERLAGTPLAAHFLAGEA